MSHKGAYSQQKFKSLIFRCHLALLLDDKLYKNRPVQNNFSNDPKLQIWFSN